MLAKRCCGHMMGVEGWMNHLILLYVGPYSLSFHINIGGPSFNIYQALEPHIIFSLEPILYLINHWNPILYFINHWNPILWLKKYHIHPPSPSQISASCSSWLQQHWARQEPNSFVSLFHHYITFGHRKKNILCVLSTLIKLYPHRDGQENLVPLLSCSSMMYRLHTCLSHLIGLKLRDSASSFHWLSSSIFSCSIGWLSRIGNTSSHLHYMMFPSIQTIYFLWGYDPGNMSVSIYLLLLSWAQFTVV